MKRKMFLLTIISVLILYISNNPVNGQLNFVENRKAYQFLNSKLKERNFENSKQTSASSIITNLTTTTTSSDEESKQQQFQKLLQLIYVAQAQVQIEAAEIQKSQKVAETARQNLEDSVNNVKIITAALHAGQENVAMNAIKAQNSQLQLAAHDQLLFDAKQKVDRLSTELVTLQAELGVSDSSKGSVDVNELVNKLKQPLSENERPKPVPSILQSNDPTIMQYSPNINTKTNDVGNHKRNIVDIKTGNTFDSLSVQDLDKLMCFLKKHRRAVESYFDKENFYAV